MPVLQDPLAYDCAPQMAAQAFTVLFGSPLHQCRHALLPTKLPLTIASSVTTIPLMESDPFTLESGQLGRSLAPFHAR